MTTFEIGRVAAAVAVLEAVFFRVGGRLISTSPASGTAAVLRKATTVVVMVGIPWGTVAAFALVGALPMVRGALSCTVGVLAASMAWPRVARVLGLQGDPSGTDRLMPRWLWFLLSYAALMFLCAFWALWVTNG